MSAELIGVISIGIMLICVFARMEIGPAMGLVGFLGYLYFAGPDGAFGLLKTVPYSTVANYGMSAIPLFVFMGAIISNTGVGSDLYNTAHKWFGQLKGGLAMSTVVACALFAAICGSSLAETLTLGKVAIPEMKKYKYDDSLSSGCVACGGTLGVLIPPSIGFLLYGILTEQSISKLFLAGILPGVLLTLIFLFVIAVWTWRNPKAGPPGPSTSLKEKVVSLKSTWHTLFLFLLVLGGIYMGIFTPTEAGAVGAFGAIMITLIKRQLNLKSLIASIRESGTTTATMLLIMIGAFVFMRFLAISKLPFVMAGAISNLGLSHYVIFAFICVLYIILGMFMEIMSCVTLTIPIIYPIVVSLGFDPIWFGVIVVILMEMGMVTPPVGLNVFVLSSVTGIHMNSIFKGVWPFVGAMLVCIVILTIAPQIVLFIPGRM